MTMVPHMNVLLFLPRYKPNQSSFTNFPCKPFILLEKGKVNLVIYFCDGLGGIGAKRGGTQEQCSQKLLELAEIFRKIIKIFENDEYI